MSFPVHLLTISRRYAYTTVSILQCRDFSQSVKVVESPTYALKRGTGGRSSFNGIVATVFGATGFLGHYVINHLGKTGTQVIIPYRSEPDDMEVKRLKVCGDLGQILFQPFHLKDPLSIRKSIKYSNVVINLIGCHFETKNFSYKDVHVEGAKDIAVACREMGVKRLIHISALNVTESPKSYFIGKPLQFLPSKLQGEQAVLEEFPDATIFRPAVIYGKRDRFLGALNTWHRLTFKSIPLYKAGTKTIKQPVYAQDLVNGIVAALKDDATKGQIFQAVGPHQYLLSEIANYCARILGREQDKSCHDALLDPMFISRVILYRYILGYFWTYPRYNLCFEQLAMEGVTDVVDPSLPTLEDLGVKLTELESIGEHLIRGRHLIKGLHYKDLVHYEPVDPPLRYNPMF